MKRYGVIALPVVLFSLIILAMHILNPQTIGPAAILFMFIMIYLFFLSLFTVVLYFGHLLIVRLGWLGSGKAVKPQKAYYIASVLACFPVFLLAIMSIGELRIIDVLLVALFVFLASFYVTKRT
jgi:hypothetical protein